MKHALIFSVLFFALSQSAFGQDVRIYTPPQRVFSQTSQVTVVNTNAETQIDGAGVGSKTFPANYFYPGKTIKIMGLGYHSAAAAPTIDIKAKFGSTIILDTGAAATNNSTNATIDIRGVITCVTTGTSGTFNVQGFYIEAGLGENVFSMVNTSTITIDTTVAQTFSMTAQFSAASSSNSITLTNLLLEATN